MNTYITNTVGMELVEVQPGKYERGQRESQVLDEKPVHKVSITHQFYMGRTQVTNAQYEHFDPNHKMLRGKNGFSLKDDEPVLFVSWYDAKAYCEWLSKRENKPYRLPTEAEWEYCCRAGSTTLYETGNELDSCCFRNQKDERVLSKVDLTVGKTSPNGYGIYDMHGNVEEWCEDWYAPYVAKDQINPKGGRDGEFKVTRGGSHHTDVTYLRSAKRHGAMPEDRSCFIGFRVVLGEEVVGEYVEGKEAKRWQNGVGQEEYQWKVQDSPYFEGPQQYIFRTEEAESIPMYSHNHCPSIAWCKNGDLLVAWFSCERESGREMTILAARKRSDDTQFDVPDEFFKVPDRNMTGTSLFHDGEGTLFHFNGVSQAAEWANLAVAMRKSQDNGVTWSKPVYINDQHQHRNQVISGTLVTLDGKIIQPCDANPAGAGGTAIHISEDRGETWEDPGAGDKIDEFKEGKVGRTIAGIHAGVVCLKNGDLMALGRGDDIGGCMPKSISKDNGKTWTYTSSGLPPISGGQRLGLRRLNEGPILLVSFTDTRETYLEAREGRTQLRGIVGTDAKGHQNTIYGMYVALSYDEGITWPVKKVISSGQIQEVEGGAWTGAFCMDQNHAEPMGYLAITQTPDNKIHLISSMQYYVFNLSWIEN